MTKRLAALWLAAIATMLAVPAPALAHGFHGRADLPVPIDMFYWAAGIALVVSFVGLGLGWKQPLLTNYPWRVTPRFSRVIYSPILVWIGRAIVLALTVLVILSAGFGSNVPVETLAPVMVWVVFWVGIAPLSAAIGNIWRELNPWATVAQVLRAPGDRPERPIPAWVGLWPTVLVLGVFVWLELVYPTTANMVVLAVVATIYSIITIGAMWWYGRNAWLDQGEAFSVYASLYAKLSPIETRAASGSNDVNATDRQLGFRWPITGTTSLRPLTGIVVLMGVVIGSVSFDGFAATTWYKTQMVTWLANASSRGLDVEFTRSLIKTLTLVAFVLLAAFLFWFYSELSGRIGRLKKLPGLGGYAGHFAHTLIPIALAYVVAHYFSYFLFQGQLAISRISDPFGSGADWFGTASWTIDYSIVSAETIWYVQVVAIVVGHVAGLALAHDRALEMTGPNSRPVLSQIPMLLLMLTFTLAGLWFLSEGLS